MNAGRITRKRTEGNFTVLSNAMLQNRALSWKARGLLAYLLSLPDDWQIYKTELHNHSDEDGRDSTAAGFLELVEAGYIIATKVRNEKGHLLGYNYDVYDVPLDTPPPITENPKTEEPITGNPATVSPIPGNPSLQNTKNNKELRDKEEIGKGREVKTEVEETTVEAAPEPSPPVAPAPSSLPEWELDPEPQPDLMAEYEQEMLCSTSWIQNTCANLHRPESWVRAAISEYIAEMRTTEQDKGRVYQDVKKHCYYWMKDQNQRQLRDANRTSKNAISGPGSGAGAKSGSPAGPLKTKGVISTSDLANHLSKRAAGR